MTKKQIIIVSIVAAILIVSIIAIVLHDRSRNNSVAAADTETQYPERGEISTDIESNLESEDEQSKKKQSKDTDNINPETDTLDASGTIVYDPNLFEKTPINTASPETSGYTIPENHHFSNIEGSSDLDNKDQAKLVITIDSKTNFDKQLQELYDIVKPVLGTNIAEEIVSYAKTKTNSNIVLDKWWQANGKEVQVCSSYDSNFIDFMSWDK